MVKRLLVSNPHPSSSKHGRLYNRCKRIGLSIGYYYNYHLGPISPGVPNRAARHRIRHNIDKNILSREVRNTPYSGKNSQGSAGAISQHAQGQSYREGTVSVDQDDIL